jgi:hypothetical protein
MRSAENDEGPASSLIAGPSVVRVGGAMLVHRHLVDVIAERSIHHGAAEGQQRGVAIAGFDSASMLYVAFVLTRARSMFGRYASISAPPSARSSA